MSGQERRNFRAEQRRAVGMGVLGFGPDERDDGTESLENRVVAEDLPDQGDHIGIGKDRGSAEVSRRGEGGS